MGHDGRRQHKHTTGAALTSCLGGSPKRSAHAHPLRSRPAQCCCARTSIMSLDSTVKERDNSATLRLGSRLKMSCGPEGSEGEGVQNFGRATGVGTAGTVGRAQAMLLSV